MKKNKKILSTGLHVLGSIYTNDIKKLSSVSFVKKEITKIIKKHYLHKIGEFYYKFKKGGGFTGLVCLTESHIAIHTWPEFGYFTLDVYICNYTKDNSKICKSVFDDIVKLFKPYRTKKF